VRALARTAVGGRGQLTVLADSLDTPRAQDPGGLTAAERRVDPDAAAPFATRLRAGEDKDQQSLALRYAHALGAGTLSAQVFGARRDFAAQLPFAGSSVVRFERAFHGASVEWRAPLRGGEWVAGLDARFQDDARERFRRGADGTFGPRNLHQREAAQAVGAYVLARTDPTARWQASAGARRDALHLAVHDRLPTDGDDSGTQRYAPVSGEASLGYALAPAHRVWVRTASAFESPTFTEFATPAGGGLNSALDPQRARGAELGIKGIAVPGAGAGADATLRYELAAFALRVRDELVPFQLPGDGRDFFANAGRARHAGIELALDWRPAPAWRLSASYTYARHRLHDHRTAGGTPLGTVDRPGLPRHTGWAEAQWQDARGRYAALELTAAGPRYADDANAVQVAGHALLGARAGRRFRAGAGTLELYAGAQNLLAQPWTGNVRINAAGARYFEPGPGRAAYAGVVWTPAAR
jgi:iron complex outermembrane recepter protein